MAKGNGHRKANSQQNQYRCSVELNQAGKQSVRIRARFARQGWELAVYFLASTQQNAMRKLEQVLRFLQQNEERLWFWGVDRSDDPKFGAELLSEVGLKLDRRTEFPPRSTTIALAPDRPLIADMLVPVRRELSHSREEMRIASD